MRAARGIIWLSARVYCQLAAAWARTTYESSLIAPYVYVGLPGGGAWPMVARAVSSLNEVSWSCAEQAVVVNTVLGCVVLVEKANCYHA